MFSYLTGRARAYFQENLAGCLQNRITDIKVGTYILVKRFEEFIGVLVVLIIAFATLTFH